MALTAPDYLLQPTSATAPASAYQFLFWDINHTIVAQNAATFVAPNYFFNAIGWYEPICFFGGCNGGKTAVTVYRYYLNSDSFAPGSPISKVAPVTAWIPPSQSVSTATAVTITASAPLPPKTRLRGSIFAVAGLPVDGNHEVRADADGARRPFTDRDRHLHPSLRRAPPSPTKASAHPVLRNLEGRRPRSSRFACRVVVPETSDLRNALF